MQAKEIYEVLVIDADISLVYEDNRSDFVRDIYIYIYIYTGWGKKSTTV